MFLDGRLGPVTATAGLIGRVDPRTGALRFIDEVRAAALLGLAVEGLPVRPGALVRIPVEGFKVADFVAGLSLDVPLR